MNVNKAKYDFVAYNASLKLWRTELNKWIFNTTFMLVLFAISLILPWDDAYKFNVGGATLLISALFGFIVLELLFDRPRIDNFIIRSRW